MGRGLPAHALGEEHAAGGFRGHAERHERHLEPRVCCDPRDVAVGQDRRADADADAVDRGEERLVELLEHADEPAVSVQLVVAVVRRLQHLAEILPGGEGSSGPRHHDASELGVSLGAEQGVPCAVPHLVVERVQRVGAVPGDEADTVGVGDGDERRGHICHSGRSCPR